MTSQMNKLNCPLTKFSFQGPTNTEYFPVENFVRRDPPVQNLDPNRTPTNFDSGFNEESSSGRDNHPPVPFNFPSDSGTRSSTPCPLNNSRIPLDPNLSPLRLNRSKQGPSNLQKSENNNNRRTFSRSTKPPSRYQAGFTKLCFRYQKPSQHFLDLPITTTLSLKLRLEALKKNRMKRYPWFEKLYFSYLLISLFYFCTPFKVFNSTESLLDDINDVSNKLRVIHYDCSKMKEIKMYALTQVSPCKITPKTFKCLIHS